MQVLMRGHLQLGQEKVYLCGCSYVTFTAHFLRE